MELPGLESLARIADPLAERFAAAGHRLYLVGGVVRDLVLTGDTTLDPAANDIDLTTDAEPPEIKQLVEPVAEALWTQGERFGTIGVRIDGQPLEITTHRAEAYDPQSRKPVVTFGRDLLEDLSRRDFTVNAMAVELPNRSFHDPYGGRSDLDAGVLRTPLSPELSFTDDPLRIMRAARFISRFSLDPSPELVTAAKRLSDRLEIVSVERVADELERLLLVDEPEPGLRFLAHTGALARIVPGYDAPALAEPAIRLAAAPGSALVRRAGLLYPLGDDAGSALTRLRYSKADRAETRRLIGAVAAGLADDFSLPDARRLLATVGVDGVPAVTALAAAVTDHDPNVRSGGAEHLVAVLDQLKRSEGLDRPDPPLDGNEIIELLDLQPGPDVGRALKFLTEHRMENGPLSPDTARRILLDWWRNAADENEHPGLR